MIKALKAVLLNAENGVNRIVEETADAGAASSPCLRLQIQALPDHSGFPKKIPVKRRAVHFERRLELCKHAEAEGAVYFYKTENGARVGDVFMSLIHTAELGHENPFEYLVALQRHAAAVEAAPAEWMPWNFRATLARISGGPDPPT